MTCPPASLISWNLRVIALDDDQEQQGSKFRWKGVEEQVAAGLILMATCGIGFIAFTVPQRLDLILEKITTMNQRIDTLEGRVDRVEGNVEDLKLKTRHIWR